MVKKKTEKPAWLKLSQAEMERLVIDLAKKGLTTEKIGLILRDQYGIPTTKLYGKKISQILKQAGIEPKSDLFNAEQNVEALKKHLAKNKQDKKAGYALISKSAITIKLRNYKGKK